MPDEAQPRTMPGLQTYADRESLLLAPYAMHSCHSEGRYYAEPEHPYRGPYQRDRDRIVHSAAFRRLSGKTQVFTGDMGDYHRTRLTHTHEVASIARTIGRALRLNEDLIEALALLHDMGHPPFGHAGEDALAVCLSAEGGFSHNDHGLTIVTQLETRYPTFPGLNLSREVLAGQAARIDKQTGTLNPLLEVQVVEAADSITYDAHDVDDALKLGILGWRELSSVPLVCDMVRCVKRRFQRLRGGMLRKALVHELIDYQVSDVLRYAGAFLGKHALRSAEEARGSDLVVGPSPELEDLKTELEKFLYQRVYRHPRLMTARAEAQDRLTTMFEGYTRNPDVLPGKFQRRTRDVGLQRSVGEYLAGMTDRFCDQQYTKHFAPPRATP
ncbi:MAG: dGTP triphosphohydrolase [Pirellulaceae bacterium]